MNPELIKTLWDAADKLRSNMDAAEYSGEGQPSTGAPQHGTDNSGGSQSSARNSLAISQRKGKEGGEE